MGKSAENKFHVDRVKTKVLIKGRSGIRVYCIIELSNGSCCFEHPLRHRIYEIHNFVVNTSLVMATTFIDGQLRYLQRYYV